MHSKKVFSGIYSFDYLYAIWLLKNVAEVWARPRLKATAALYITPG